MPTLRPTTRAPRTHLHWVLLALAVGTLPLLAALATLPADPRGYGTHEQLLLPSCLPMRLLGVPCPGCGVTTAAVHALGGDVLRALAVQPLGAVLVALAVLLAPAALALAASGRDLGALFRRIHPPWWWALALVALASWLYKLTVVLVA